MKEYPKGNPQGGNPQRPSQTGNPYGNQGPQKTNQQPSSPKHQPGATQHGEWQKNKDK